MYKIKSQSLSRLNNKQRMQVTDHSTSLKQLKKFLLNFSQSPQPDPYWQSILQSDIRNIIPKHEVSKIQLVKTNLSKIRLILQNLSNFISLQIKKKHLKDEMIDLNENISIELQQLAKQQNRNDNKYHYDSNLLVKRKQLQINRTLHQLQSLVGQNKKWVEYIRKNVNILSTVQQPQLHQQIVNFISTYQSLFNITPLSSQSHLIQPSPQTLQMIILKSGMYTKMYESKIRERILIEKLVENIYGLGKDAIGKQVPNNDEQQQDYWSTQVKRLREVHNL